MLVSPCPLQCCYSRVPVLGEGSLLDLPAPADQRQPTSVGVAGYGHCWYRSWSAGDPVLWKLDDAGAVVNTWLCKACLRCWPLVGPPDVPVWVLGCLTGSMSVPQSN